MHGILRYIRSYFKQVWRWQSTS